MQGVPELYAIAKQQNIPVLPFPLPENGSMSLMLSDGSCYIGMDQSICDGGVQEQVHLSHELGHCLTGSFYTVDSGLCQQRRCEERADRWAIRQLIPAVQMTMDCRRSSG